MNKWYLNAEPKIATRQQLETKIKHGYAEHKEEGLYTVLTNSEGRTVLEVWKVDIK